MPKALPKVAIIGRANVGKSTLFNRLIEQDKALVSSISGTTRDRNIGIVSWRGKKFELTDTGGLDIDEKIPEPISQGIVKQAQQAMIDADLVLFVIDLIDGATPVDRDLAKKLIAGGFKEKTIFVGNKAETAKLKKYDSSIYRLGLGEPVAISASSGSGTGDLLDEILEKLPNKKLKSGEADIAKPDIKIALLGRPNVGKSSLLNSILGEDRVIVSDIAHTTREAHDTEFSYKDKKFLIIDTAGIRRKSKIERGTLEKRSVGKSLDALDDCDVAVLITECNKKIDAQDKKITQAILESGKSVIIAANKWDLIGDKETNTIKDYENFYRKSFPYLWWAPLIFISAKENLRTHKLLNLAIEIKAAREIKIADSQLDKFLKQKIKQHKPSRGKGLKNPYIYEITQSSTNPPRFVIYVNDPTVLHFSYIRFLQNNLREKFKIIGTPIQVELRKWKEDKKK
ncbi:MAG: GTPase Der [Parcubacteria group bacterium ADurb.Bin326]|nr:MAG: GTPase Der [Parcubacteria group bacterium ADurb.Bin326]